MTRSGSPYSTPRDANHVPLLVAASTADGITPVVLEADPTTHALVTSGAGGGGGTQYTDGAAAVTHPIGTQPVFTNGSNIVTAVSTANSLPITGTISVGSTTDSSAFTAGSSTTGPIAGVFNDSATALTSGQQGTARSTANRAIHTNLRNNSGTEIGTASTPVQVSLANTAANATAVKVDGSAVTQPVSGTFFQATQPVSASSLPLPTGAATSVNQSTEIASLATIATNTTQTPSTPSINNSSTATLLAAATFTGTSDDCINYSEMRVTVFSNVASATDGLSMQQSEDNTNWDVIDTYTMPAMTAGQGKTFVVPRQARYFRVVYTNGGTNQTTFRLQTILNRTGTAPSSNRASDAYTNETDLVQNQVFLMGYNGTTWDRLRTTGTGVLTTSTVLTAGAAAIGSITNTSFAVTQATAANLNATVVGTGTFVTQATLAAETTKVIGTVNQGTSPWVGNTSQINGVAPLMGNGTTGTGSQRVTISSDNTPFSIKMQDGSGTALTSTAGSLNVVQQAATGTPTNVAGSATSVTLLASNSARKGGSIYNDSTALLYVKFGTTASTTSFKVILAASAYYEIPAGYIGRIDGIWASATGTARIDEDS